MVICFKVMPRQYLLGSSTILNPIFIMLWLDVQTYLAIILTGMLCLSCNPVQVVTAWNPWSCNNNQSRWRHPTVNGEVCCNRVKCKPGEFVSLCNGSNDSKCLPCPSDHFQDKHTDSLNAQYECKKHTDCPSHLGMIVTLSGNLTHDLRCECNLLFGYYDKNRGQRSGRPEFCVQKACTHGFELNKYGKCRRCQEGTYKDYAGFGFCRPHPKKEYFWYILAGLLSLVIIIFITDFIINCCIRIGRCLCCVR